ncbi:hypothetical protein DL769_010104 [Monosporascus sp. CRB-8-3]|nr:hypothetical protein DL769_010104 [Monosporascus sp. CRB-8-3]
MGGTGAAGDDGASSSYSASNQDGDSKIVRTPGEDDSSDPRNWPMISRSEHMAVLSLPIFAGPLSESVGRNPTYLVSTFCYMLFVMGSALAPEFAGQIVCRYIVSLFSSAILGINGSSITGDKRFALEHEAGSLLTRLQKIFPFPASFLTTEPVIAVLGAYLVLLYIPLFSFQSGFDYLFKGIYGLSTGQTGHCFAAIAAGATFFTVGTPGLCSWARSKTGHVRGAPVPPEFRSWPALTAAPLLPASLF